jgi:hypothetical protein
VLEAQLGKLRSHLEDMGVVVAEGGREEQRRAVEIDHRLDRLLDRVGLGHLLLLDHLDAAELLQRRGALGMGLVVAIVVARADVDESDRGILGRGRTRGGGGSQSKRCAALEEVATGDGVEWHAMLPAAMGRR